MIRLLLITLLILLCNGPAYAEWVEIGTTSTATAYADPDTIRRKGDMVKMWDVMDFKTIQTDGYGKAFLSDKMQSEFDCAEEQFRIMAFYFYSGAMGTGEIVYFNTNPGLWAPVNPGSVSEGKWKFACGKK